MQIASSYDSYEAFIKSMPSAHGSRKHADSGLDLGHFEKKDALEKQASPKELEEIISLLESSKRFMQTKSQMESSIESIEKLLGDEKSFWPPDAIKITKASNQVFMLSVESALRANGIALEDGEEFNVNVDKDSKITVTGNNMEKAKTIENLLNSIYGANS